MYEQFKKKKTYKQYLKGSNIVEYTGTILNYSRFYWNEIRK